VESVVVQNKQYFATFRFPRHYFQNDADIALRNLLLYILCQITDIEFGKVPHLEKQISEAVRQLIRDKSPKISRHKIVLYLHLLFLSLGGGVRLSALGTSAATGLLYPPRMQMMSVEQAVKWQLAGETEVLGETLPQCHYTHHKYHILDQGSNPGSRGGKPATNRLRCDTACTPSGNFLGTMKIPLASVLNILMGPQMCFSKTAPSQKSDYSNFLRGHSSAYAKFFD
jgi:hypothetical protein